MNIFQRTFGMLSFVALAAITQSNAMDGDTATAAAGDTMYMHMMKISRGFGFISGGISWFDDSRLNQRLTSMGLSGIRDNVASVSIGHQRDYGKLIMESALTANIWKDNLNSGLRTSLQSWDLLWNTGFNVLPADAPVTVFPYMGLGLGFNVMRLRTDTKTLSELLTSMEPNSFLWQGAVLFNVGIGSDFILSGMDKTKGLVLGVRAGYCYDLYTFQQWYSDGIAISDVPWLRHNGGYVRIILGGWGERKHDKMHHMKMKKEE